MLREEPKLERNVKLKKKKRAHNDWGIRLCTQQNYQFKNNMNLGGSQMEGQTITIPMKQYEELMRDRAAIYALQCYVKSDKYPNRKVMCDIVGIEFEGDD